jgi:branched-subunit amino acid ABC-type transport system permease component
MGVLLFRPPSGLTIIFGLMDVLNLTHGAFFAWTYKTFPCSIFLTEGLGGRLLGKSRLLLVLLSLAVRALPN